MRKFDDLFVLVKTLIFMTSKHQHIVAVVIEESKDIDFLIVEELIGSTPVHEKRLVRKAEGKC